MHLILYVTDESDLHFKMSILNMLHVVVGLDDKRQIRAIYTKVYMALARS